MAAEPDRPGEFELIARYFRPLAGSPEALGLVDDAALLRAPAGREIVVTTDMVVAGVHFLPDDPPAAIAQKALRVNLSDLAAKGAAPFAYLLGLSLATGCDGAWLAGFAGGLREDQARFGVTLLGGDTVVAPGPLTIAITAFGHLPAGTMVHRSGARPGDLVVVSGTIGDAALGLRARLEPGLGDGRPLGHLLDRYLHPRPRVALSPAVRRYATASMDVSDGLVGDLAQICRASGVTATVDAAAVPLSAQAAALVAFRREFLAIALTGGDDYEILATLPPDRLAALAADAAAAGESVTAIGRIVAGEGPPAVRGADGRAIDLGRPLSWEHGA